MSTAPTATLDATADATAAGRPEIRLLAGRHKRVRAGHPWIFSNEIDMTAAVRGLDPGTLVTARDAAGKPVGVAMFNPRSLIAARLLGPDPAAKIDRDFFTKAMGRAFDLRTRLFDAPYYRAVHAEADGLPGLIVDRYGDVLVLQINTAGMALLLDEVLAALDAVAGPAAVLLRNVGPARALEGLEEETSWAKGAGRDTIEVIENGVRFAADAAGGQKTGWYYDQRENRRLVAGLARGARVLDLYSYLGGFGIQAAAAGADRVVMVDRSQPALALAERSAQLNNVAERCKCVRGNVFYELERFAKAGQRYDIVVADPPAFVKTKKDLRVGARGYRKLARLSAGLVAPGGFLFTASCSHHVSADLFAGEVRGGLSAAGRTGRILSAGGAGPDHPVHPHLPESAYLKYQLLQLD
jgi:23S rRNA (cytosine1962-C5)-methyltransferase